MTIRQALPTFRGPNYYVPELAYAVDVGLDGICRADLGAPVALNATGILNAQSIATAGNTQTFAAAYYTALGNPAVGLARYGRNLTYVASGAATSTVTVDGQDYLGQPMRETITLNGNTPVAGTKMFWSVSNISWTNTSATTINVGWGDVLGLPYRACSADLLFELTAGAKPTAGTLVAGVTTNAQTATTADPRGRYTPNQATDGVKTYVFDFRADVESPVGLHGVRHFGG